MILKNENPSFNIICIFNKIRNEVIMNINYFFLWNYNKLPLIYSIMKSGEKNILIININDCKELSVRLLKLKSLEKIDDIILMKNNSIEYFFNVMKRIFVYPFKIKKQNIIFYLDGFVGYYPLILSNIGKPNKIYFYEEGESTYCEGVLFEKKPPSTFKNKINALIKKVLFIKKNKIDDISGFFVRDKQRLENVFSARNGFRYKFPIQEVDDVEAMKSLSDHDKETIKSIFFSNLSCDLMANNIDFKKAIVLTQPTYLYGIHTKEQLSEFFNLQILNLKERNFEVYLKLHPREKEDIYLKDGVKRISGDFPFEFLAIYNIEFDIGLTYNSTAIKSSLIKEKILLCEKK